MSKKLVDAAKKYLKTNYGEDTVWMDITKNEVANGNGKLHVNCRVRFWGMESDWSKVFTFRDGKVISMSARKQRHLKRKGK